MTSSPMAKGGLTGRGTLSEDLGREGSQMGDLRMWDRSTEALRPLKEEPGAVVEGEQLGMRENRGWGSPDVRGLQGPC